MVALAALPQSLSSRCRSWESTQAPPARYKDFAYPEGQRLAMTATGAEILRAGIDEAGMSFPAIISTQAVDRVGDVLIARGGRTENYRRGQAPVFFGHQQMPLPLGSALDRSDKLHVAAEADQVLSRCFVVQRGRWAETAADIFHLIVEGALGGVSVGFDPIGPVKQLETGGHQFDLWDLLEWSVVGVAANPYCHIIRSFLSKGRITGRSINPMLVKSLEPLAAPLAAWSSGADFASPRPVAGRLGTADPVRWNKSLSMAFDVAAEALPASRLEYDWVSKHLAVPVKEVFQSGTMVPSARMGSWLTGLRHALAEYELVDVRNLSGSSESPPVYEVLQLTSTLRDDFLIDGMVFYRGLGRKFAVKFQPEYSGLYVTAYTSYPERMFNRELLDKADRWARENNYLKGEAFALSGEFLPRTQESWDDVFLEEENKKPLRRVIDLLNQKGKNFACRGMIFCGPPGTGKTLSSRIIRNQADATFIWVSARDFHRSGGFGGVALGFELARELASSVLCFEDVDNWLSPHTIDLLKTEMDGISRSSGVLTVLTTNFPEQLPEALIDRPGRFHDVLRFGLPTPKARRAMLAKWLDSDSPGGDVEQAVVQTEGYSGAHVYELAQFARTLREHDGLPPTQALKEALRKVEEQRELITEMQLAGSRYRPRKDLEEIMSKRYGKPGRPKVVPAKKKDGLAETSGTSGGYVAPEQTAPVPTGEAAAKCMAIKARVKEVMDAHAPDAPAEGPHDAHYHAEKSLIHHHHAKSAHPDHLSRVKADLEGIDGVAGTSQGPEPPAGDGWEKAYSREDPKAPPVPGAGMSMDDMTRMLRIVPKVHRPTLRALPAGVMCKAVLGLIPHPVKEALATCVRTKVLEIAADHPGWEPEQHEAVAYSACRDGRKEFDDMLDKDEADNPGIDDLDLDTPIDAHMGGDLPHGAALTQEVVELIESKLEQLEPERREFWEEVLANLMAHGGETYPDVHFGGEEDVPAAETDKEDEEEEEEALAPYENVPKRYRPRLVKNLHPRHKNLLKEVADHLHEGADLDQTKPIPKGYKSACRVHARAMDAMHGAVTGGSEVGDEEEDESTEETKDPAEQTEAPGTSADVPDAMIEEAKSFDPALLLDVIGGAMDRALEKKLSRPLYRLTGERAR